MQKIINRIFNKKSPPILIAEISANHTGSIKKAKKLILALNERYKKTKDAKLMDIMKRLTAIKRKAEKRIKAKIVV